MSAPASAAPLLSPNTPSEVVRHSAKFRPSIWGDHFMTYTSNDLSIDATMTKQIEELKAAVRRKLVAAADKPSKKLNVIDTIQQLGLAYHFKIEIEEALEHIFHTYHAENNDEGDDLYHVALRFRLLRQQGYPVSCDMFSKFRDNNGDFVGDVQGMLSLYEATHLRVHGEDILDQALAFSTTYLQSMAAQLSSPLATQVIHALKQPIHKGIPRLEARKYISIYEQEDFHDDTLLRLAKLDFNLLQKIHQKELSELSKWWKDLDFATKLPFARDRMVEGYLWVLGVYFEPEYSLARRILTKIINMASIIDDAYDAYGTIDELELFTEAIERWDMCAIDQLPEYMKTIYRALFDVYSEMEEEMAKQGRSYRVHYAIEAMKNLARAYHAEAIWCSKNYVPTFEEYMHIALMSTGYEMLETISFVGMGDIATKETFEWLFSNPQIAKASTTICRLLDDLVSHKFEQQRGHVASAVECYMKQHDVSELEVCEEFRRQVTNAWKDINQECLKPIAMPMPILMRVVNFARVMDVVYKEEDGYTSGIALKDVFNKFKDNKGNFLDSIVGDVWGMLNLWWKDLDFAMKLPFARDRMVECYFWMVVIYFEPECYLGRRILTKVITMALVMDDIFDFYGTIEELELFMEAVERWDMSTIDQLPEYMEIYYRALLDIYSELEDDWPKKEDPTSSIMQKKLMGDFVTKEAFEWVLNEPNTIVNVASIIGRIMNNLVSHEECLKPTTAVPMTLLTRVLNLAQVSYVVYRDGDGYTNSKLLLKDYIVSLLIDPVAI
ncbi:hypothetical protein L1049_001659 [Liquidambar formosana]|uniref:Uncharacterized protein n=1 Tax=Liquidambar formosana TaxID=63359 RepID=A0AAP0N7W1_LIQFO